MQERDVPDPDTPGHQKLIEQARRYIAAGRFAEAVRCFEQGVAAAPDDSETLADLGAALIACGRAQDAVGVLTRAALQVPENAFVFYNLGQAYEQLGDFVAASTSHQQAVRVAPDFAPAHQRLGGCLEKLGRIDEALSALETALRYEPEDGGSYYNLGVVLLRLRRFEQAQQAFATALQRGYRAGPVYNNLGLSLYRQGRMAEAREQFRRALELDARFVSAWDNLGNALMEEGEVAAAIRHYERAVEIDAAAPTAQLNLALAYLTVGDFSRGWPLFDARLLPGADRVGLCVPRDVPLWMADSATTPPREIILVTEQGFGDAIQFVRFGAVLAQRGLTLILQCQPRLRRLLSSAGGFSDVVADGTQYPAGRYHWYPLMSVPAALATRLDSIPAATPYLRAETERVNSWRARFGQGCPRIGIAWQGDAQHEHDSVHARSIPLAQFTELIALPGIEWISLQKGVGAEQLLRVPWRERVRSFGAELDGGADAFLDTAAIMMSLDLIITADTAIAHLAGALGCEVWVALNYMPDWRWLLERADSPWYPTMRLFRQSQARDWPGVFDKLKKALLSRAAENQ
jgi:tetratricopeptide (TPR) repeat protein